MATGIKRPLKPYRPIINGGIPLVRGLVFDSMVSERAAVLQDLAGRLKGTIVGAPTVSNDLYGPAMKFAGATDAVTFALPATSKLESLLSFSYECLFNMTGTGGGATGYIVCKSNAGPPYFLISCGSATTIQMLAGYATTAGSWNVTVAQNTWNHLVVNYTFGLSNVPVAFLNGVSVAVATGTTPTGTAPTDNANIYVGNNSTGTRNWAGQISHVRAWNRLLSQAEVTALNDNPWCIYRPPLMVAR